MKDHFVKTVAIVGAIGTITFGAVTIGLLNEFDRREFRAITDVTCIWNYNTMRTTCTNIDNHEFEVRLLRMNFPKRNPYGSHAYLCEQNIPTIPEVE